MNKKIKISAILLVLLITSVIATAIVEKNTMPALYKPNQSDIDKLRTHVFNISTFPKSATLPTATNVFGLIDYRSYYIYTGSSWVTVDIVVTGGVESKL